jgi:hypothetical protein
MLSANIFGTFNQYHSDALSEKMRGRTRQSAAAGRFPWRAPIGYINVGESLAPTSSLMKNAPRMFAKASNSWHPDGTKKAKILRS